MHLLNGGGHHPPPDPAYLYLFTPRQEVVFGRSRILLAIPRLVVTVSLNFV